jgi:hypothetical protein
MTHRDYGGSILTSLHTEHLEYCDWVGVSRCFVLSYMAKCFCISAALVLNLSFEGQMDKWYKAQFKI